MHFGKLARTSLSLLLQHRLRSLAAVGAIFVGQAALVLAVGAAQAGHRDLQAKLRQMGANLLVVRAGTFQQFGRRVAQVSRATTLLPQDALRLGREVAGVKKLATVASAVKTVRFQANVASVPVVGVSPEYFELQRLALQDGRLFFAEEDRARTRVAVLGAKVAKALAAVENPLDQRVRIAGVPFKVVGVLRPKEVGIAEIDPDQSVFVPVSTLLFRVAGRSWLDAIIVQGQSPEKLPRLSREIREALRRAHGLAQGKEDDFTVQDPVRLLALEHDLGEAFRALAAGMAGVCIATGAVGIVAVMLMAVRERTREIGLRRAVGATRAAILVQFLFEAALLTALGGFSGAAFALPAQAAICKLAGWPTVWPLKAALAAGGVSVVLGLVCGVAPAIRAARLAPATAVRAAA